MKRHKKSTSKRPRTRTARRTVTLGEIKRALEIQRVNPAWSPGSPRLRKALASWKKNEPATLAEFKAASDKAFAGINESMKKLPPEGKRLWDALNSNPEAPWGVYSFDDFYLMFMTTRGRSGAPTREETQTRIRIAAQLSLENMTLYKQAKRLFPGSQNGYRDTRTFYTRNRKKIDEEKERALRQKRAGLIPRSTIF